ncbi:MAG: hypothetical protein ACD_39C01298G0001, partial [uncultured bacterium]
MNFRKKSEWKCVGLPPSAGTRM